MRLDPIDLNLMCVGCVVCVCSFLAGKSVEQKTPVGK